MAMRNPARAVARQTAASLARTTAGRNRKAGLRNGPNNSSQRTSSGGPGTPNPMELRNARDNGVFSSGTSRTAMPKTIRGSRGPKTPAAGKRQSTVSFGKRKVR
jgi:hypothetical protein